MRTIVTITVTDVDTCFRIEEAAATLETENQIHFPDEQTREEFIEDCTACVIDKFDRYSCYFPNFISEVLDTARIYGLTR